MIQEDYKKMLDSLLDDEDQLRGLQRSIRDKKLEITKAVIDDGMYDVLSVNWNKLKPFANSNPATKISTKDKVWRPAL